MCQRGIVNAPCPGAEVDGQHRASQNNQRKLLGPSCSQPQGSVPRLHSKQGKLCQKRGPQPPAGFQERRRVLQQREKHPTCVGWIETGLSDIPVKKCALLVFEQAQDAPDDIDTIATASSAHAHHGAFVRERLTLSSASLSLSLSISLHFGTHCVSIKGNVSLASFFLSLTEKNDADCVKRRDLEECGG